MPKAPKSAKPEAVKVEATTTPAKPVRKMPTLKMSPLTGSKDAPKRVVKSLPTRKDKEESQSKPASSAAPSPKKTKSEMLAKLLFLRAAQTKKSSQKAAKSVNKTDGRLPQSVIKAAERLNPTKSPVDAPEVNVFTAVEVRSEPSKPKKRRKRKSPYSKTELKELRGILETERKRLVKDLDLINDMASSTEESMSRTFSSHQADAAQDSSSLETTFVTRRYGEERLHQIVVALERIEDGSYGLCEMCADEKCGLCESCPFIPISRLRAKPFAKFCVQLRSQFEKSNRQK